MKKKLIALLVLFLTSCSSNTNNISINTELASFLDKFNKVYPNGFVLEDGYYEITKETQSFNINENTRTFKNENFKGKLVTNLEHCGKSSSINSGIYQSHTTIINDKNENYSSKETIQEFFINDKKLYSLNQEKENGKIVSSLSTGSKDILSSTMVFFNAEPIYALNQINKWTNINNVNYGVSSNYSYAYVEISNNSIFVYDYYNHRIFLKYKFDFDSNFNLVKIICDYGNGNLMYSMTIIPCDAIEVTINENYDKQYESTSIAVYF